MAEGGGRADAGTGSDGWTGVAEGGMGSGCEAAGEDTRERIAGPFAIVVGGGDNSEDPPSPSEDPEMHAKKDYTPPRALRSLQARWHRQ